MHRACHDPAMQLLSRPALQAPRCPSAEQRFIGAPAACSATHPAPGSLHTHTQGADSPEPFVAALLPRAVQQQRQRCGRAAHLSPLGKSYAPQPERAPACMQNAPVSSPALGAQGSGCISCIPARACARLSVRMSKALSAASAWGGMRCWHFGPRVRTPARIRAHLRSRGGAFRGQRLPAPSAMASGGAANVHHCRCMTHCTSPTTCCTSPFSPVGVQRVAWLVSWSRVCGAEHWRLWLKVQAVADAAGTQQVLTGSLG